MIIPLWITLSILAGIGSNILNFFSRYILKDGGDATAWAWTYEFLRLLIFIPFLFFDNKLILTFESAVILFLIGITEFISVYLYMKMHQYTHLSISTIISRTRLVWIPIIAFLFFGERLTSLQYAGIVILFLGLSIAVAPRRLFLDKGAMYANSAAFMIAINTILIKEATPFASASIIMIFFSLPSVILFPLLMKNAKRRLITNNLNNVLPKLSGVISNVIASFLLIAALNIGDVSRVNALYQGMMIMGVLAGIIFLKERQDVIKKLVGTAVTIIGVILLT